jgi:hypothetical protein
MSRKIIISMGKLYLRVERTQHARNRKEEIQFELHKIIPLLRFFSFLASLHEKFSQNYRFLASCAYKNEQEPTLATTF